MKKDLLGLLEGRETYVIGKDGVVKMVSPVPFHGALLRWSRHTGVSGLASQRSCPKQLHSFI